jgi:predicted glycosyltransferase
MDPGFSELYPTDENLSLTEVQEERKAILYSLFEKTAPDLFMVELYPFGRKRFGFELLPILEELKNGALGSPGVVCSLRDILVEKENQKAYERRVVGLLNQYFDALLIHSDPSLVTLEETFLSTAEIRLPVVYTGFVTSRPDPDAGIKLRNRLEIGADEILVVASAGGGKVGATLLRAVLEAGFIMAKMKKLRLYVFCGPLMSDFDFTALLEQASAMPGVELARFTKEFISFLTAADLSVSMAGYNTCMNILAAGVPALVWPFGQNREQRLRAKKLDGLGRLTMLSDLDLKPSRLAMIMAETLEEERDSAQAWVKLDGAQETARWLEEWRSLENSRNS